MNSAFLETFLKNYKKFLLNVKSVRQIKSVKIPNQHKYADITAKTRYFLKILDKVDMFCYISLDI